jgi:hypothetical protein
MTRPEAKHRVGLPEVLIDGSSGEVLAAFAGCQQEISETQNLALSVVLLGRSATEEQGGVPTKAGCRALYRFPSPRPSQ